MECEVEFSDEFGEWWATLTEAEQEDVRAGVKLLEAYGTVLSYPYSSGVSQSKHDHMRELRIQHKGRPYRVLYAFDPRRVALLLIGGDKTGNEGWYDAFVPIADRIYDVHLQELEQEQEGKKDGEKVLRAGGENVPGGGRTKRRKVR
jgi:hypothetical protein